MLQIAKLLNKSVLFRKKRKVEVIELLKDIKFQIKTFEKDEIIFNIGDNLNYIGIILSGKVKIEKVLENGRVIYITYKKTGGLFGSCANFSNKQQTTSNVIASFNSKIIFFDKINFLNLISKETGILNNYIKMLANQTFFLNKKIELFSYSGIQERIAFYLLNIEKDVEGIIVLPFSKKDWAEYLNVSRSSFFRELKKMSDETIIQIDKKQIRILDKKRLIKIIAE